MKVCKDCSAQITHGSKTGYCRRCSRKHYPVWNKGLSKADAPQLSNSGVRSGTEPFNKGKPMQESQRVKISCKLRGISEDEFDDFTHTENRRLRSKFDDSGLSKSCFEGADYTCDLCGDRGVELNAHHLDSWSSSVDKRFDLGNLVCLCRVCHLSFHSECGYETTREQYEEFKKAKQIELGLLDLD